MVLYKFCIVFIIIIIRLFFYFTLFSLVFFLFLYTAQLLVHLCLAAPSQTVVSCILYTLHLYFELLGE